MCMYVFMDIIDLCPNELDFIVILIISWIDCSEQKLSLSPLDFVKEL